MDIVSMRAVAFAAGTVTLAQQSQGSDADLTSFTHSSIVCLVSVYLVTWMSST